MEVAKPLISRQDALTRYPIGRIVRCCAYRASGLVLWHKADFEETLPNAAFGGEADVAVTLGQVAFGPYRT